MASARRNAALVAREAGIPCASVRSSVQHGRTGHVLEHRRMAVAREFADAQAAVDIAAQRGRNGDEVCGSVVARGLRVVASFYVCSPRHFLNRDDRIGARVRRKWSNWMLNWWSAVQRVRKMITAVQDFLVPEPNTRVRAERNAPLRVLRVVYHTAHSVHGRVPVHDVLCRNCEHRARWAHRKSLSEFFGRVLTPLLNFLRRKFEDWQVATWNLNLK
ncbi:hypothetical protein FB451DRAFT_1162547 [Mycena latifolia]|nr:hypothetical protein FB451DRAFT_1162547 [Mycena latifolia]